MYPYPSFEDSWLKIISMQIYNTDFVVCAKKQKLRRCKKHKKYNTHTKTFSNYIWLCVVNGKTRQSYRIFIMKTIFNFINCDYTNNLDKKSILRNAHHFM